MYQFLTVSFSGLLYLMHQFRASPLFSVSSTVCSSFLVRTRIRRFVFARTCIAISNRPSRRLWYSSDNRTPPHIDRFRIPVDLLIVAVVIPSCGRMSSYLIYLELLSIREPLKLSHCLSAKPYFFIFANIVLSSLTEKQKSRIFWYCMAKKIFHYYSNCKITIMNIYIFFNTPH